MTQSADTTKPPVDGANLRRAMGRFLTGVTIITVCDAALCPYGLTVNSFNSVSLTPPLVLWSLDKRNLELQTFKKASGFAVNIMSAEQVDLCYRFAAADDRFTGCNWHIGNFGQPVLDDALVSMECRHWAEYDGGDHVIFVGEVLSIVEKNGAPLAFFEGKFGRYDQLG